MIDEKLDFILKGGRTKRYHTNGTIREQTVAEHSFYVAWLLKLMYSNPHVITRGIEHDIAEGAVGDVASPVKRAMPELKILLDRAEDDALKAVNIELTTLLGDEEYRQLKMADNLEGMLHCAEEIRRGNTDAIEIYKNFRDYALALEPFGKELEVMHAVERRLTCQTSIIK